MAIRIVRFGTKRTKGEGTRIGTVRRPPRGVPKMANSEISRVLDLLARIAKHTDVKPEQL